MEEKKSVICEEAHMSLGHYSQAIKMNDYIYISGQLPLEPKTQKLCSEDFKEQAMCCLNNLGSLLQVVGGQTSNILKMTIYLRSIADMEKLNELLKERFAFVPPAMSFVEVSSLPKGALIEIDGIANIPPVQVKGGLLV